MSRFFFHSSLVAEEIILLSPEESRHLLVERIKPRSSVLLCDGKGNLFRGVYEEEQKGRARIRVKEKVREEKKSFDLIVWQAMLKSPSRLDWLVEKLTEIGVTRIGFFFSHNSLKDTISRGKKTRWEKIILSACKQSGRTIFPDLILSEQWTDFVSSLYISPGTIVLADPEGDETLWSFLKDQTEKSFQIVIGPEGDLTKEEKKEILQKGRGLKVSKKILRSETASLFCASVVASFLENE